MLFYPISWKKDDQVSNAKLFRQSLKLISLLREYAFRPKCMIDRKGADFPSSPHQWQNQELIDFPAILP
jgi:hypothetical protein